VAGDVGDVTEPAGLRWAAVALIVVPDPEAFLLIRRAERAGDPWSGHLALPGGRRHADDPDLIATAIRETHEEVGIVLERTSLARALPDVVPRTPALPPLAIRPFVFTLAERPPIVPNPEVAGTVWVELGSLREPGARDELGMELGGAHRVVPAYRTAFGPVWGLTERILTLYLGPPAAA
jgi:8-oxo-dGTP pyrophosphatase MutT (NUDIX family)